MELCFPEVLRLLELESPQSSPKHQHASESARGLVLCILRARLQEFLIGWVWGRA